MTFSTMVGELAYAFINTFLIFVFTLLGALPLGLAVYFGKKSRFKPLKWFMEVYISIMRGTPLMLQVMVIYFAPALQNGFESWDYAAAGTLPGTVIGLNGQGGQTAYHDHAVPQTPRGRQRSRRIYPRRKKSSGSFSQ